MSGGILKSSPKGESGEKGGKVGIKWDEEVIAEHDKERGTRMKIDEPDTPFEAPIDVDAVVAEGESGVGESDLAAEFADLENAMAEEGGEWGDGEDGEWEEEEVEEKKDTTDFSQHRQKHYGGMGVNLKELLRKGMEEEEEEEEEEGGDEDGDDDDGEKRAGEK